MNQNLSKSAILGGVALLLVAPVTHADKGFSVGISGVRTSADFSNVGLDVDGDSTGRRLFGTYMFNDTFGIEAGFSDYSRPDDSSLSPDQEIERESQDLYAVGNYSVTENFSLFGKAGVVSSRNSIEVDEKNVASASSTDLSLALGGEYDLFTRFAIRGEYQWLDGQESGASNILSISGIFRFR